MAKKKSELKIKISKLFNNIYFQRLFIILISTILIILIAVTQVLFFLDSRTYDLFMTSLKKPIVEDESLMLIDIDDNVMNWLPYSWPIPRKYHGDAMEVLADFDAKAVVFDIEFIEESRISADLEMVESAKNNVYNDMQVVLDQVINKTDQVFNNPGQSGGLNDLYNTYNMAFSDFYFKIIKNIESIPENQDKYFADRIRYFGRAFGTVNMLYDFNLEDDEEIDVESEERSNFYLQKYGYKLDDLLNGRDSHPAIITANVAEFPTDVVLNEFVNVGFTRVERDRDGTLRNMPLFIEKNGYVIPQLSFRPFLTLYNIGVDQIDLSSSNQIVLRDVQINEEEKVDIKIPVFDKKMDRVNKTKKLMRVHWPSGDFAKIFAYNIQMVKEGKEKPQHFSYRNLLNYKLVILKGLEESLLNNFGQFEQNSDEFRFFNEYFVSMQEKKRIIENDPNSSQMSDDINNYFVDYLQRLNNYLSEENIQKKEKEFDTIINAERSKDNKEMMVKQKEQRVLALRDVKNAVENTIKARQDLNILKGKICFLGWTATGTTDIGANPFDKVFENVGTHPSVLNTILQRDFIRVVPTWMIMIVTVLFFGLIIWLISKRDAIIIAAIGFSSTIVGVVSIGVFYFFTNIYISPVVPFLYGFISFLIMIALKFILSEREKGSIRNAFNKYLSPDVIGELLKDPSKLELGGIRANCTAIFTDIQGFSSISEKFMDDPPGLVSLLNNYLSAMSDIILENRGTIDKYEGDAIIGFFGAPVKMDDHALKACISSIRMKEIEDDLNKKILAEGLADAPLKTRIGINTGDMFVGNMGTTEKFNYTMMGHSVNLAARLEGVNKQYGIFQLISEYTYQYVMDDIAVRRLDRVRVVNIKTPIRLYELIALKSELKPKMKEMIEIFDQALDLFEKRKYLEAKKIFLKVLQNFPNDGPAKIYLDRCNKYMKKPMPASWDGVYNLTSK